MKWYYYICNYGPGHQSQDDGFIEADGTLKEISEDLIDRKFRDVDWPILRMWEVPSPPQYFLDNEKNALLRRIQYAQERLAVLETLTGAPSFTQAGKNDAVIAKMERAVRTSLMKNLHKRGVYVESSTIDKWRRGEEQPTTLSVDKVLEALRRCDKYPDYNKKKAKAK